MKSFAAVFMISGLATIASPALTQASAAPNELMQGLEIVRVAVEWVVLIGLIVSMFTSSWLVVNRRSSRRDSFVNTLKAPIFLGLLAGGTAIILEDWSLLLMLDVGLALTIVRTVLGKGAKKLSIVIKCRDNQTKLHQWIA